ncbi:MAG TPA: AAA family ATPase [Myxococcota bacterium]|nr:AAA family ATPase [Myxococcota bacterium]
MARARTERSDLAEERFIRSLRFRHEAAPAVPSYPFSIPAVRALAEAGEIELGPVTFLVGENGTGKSTLLEAVANAAGFNPEGGSRNFHFSTRDSHSQLSQALMLIRNAERPLRDGFFFRAESFFNVATQIDQLGVVDSYGGVSLHEMSHGEAFVALLKHRVRYGFYVFDEPEAALSPARQLAALRMIYDRMRAGAQFLIATHAPILMSLPGAVIYALSERGLARVPYTETEHFLLSRSFFASPERMLSHLLADDAESEASPEPQPESRAKPRAKRR